VTVLLRSFTNKRVCCVGDGGNDVEMIRSANVGIGIQGKEGLQAALASDFSISTFKDAVPLILWHGRQAYRSSVLLSYVLIHRGILVSVINLYFSALFNFLAYPFFNGLLMFGFTGLFTSCPAFCLIFDRDTTYDVSLLYPDFYKQMQRNRDLSVLKALQWLATSIYQVRH